MSTDRDVTRVLRSWLHEDAYEDADRVLDLVLDQLETTRQRRAFWLRRRFPSMSNNVRIALAAAAVVVVALIGFQLFRGGNVGGPGPSPSESPTQAPTATPVASPAAFPPSGQMAIGRHPMTLAGHKLSIEFPTAGWLSNGQWGVDRGSLTAPDSANFIFWPDSAPDTVFSDPCSETNMSPPPGTSAVELAAAVAGLPGINVVSGPSAVTVGGYPSQHVVFTVPSDIGCAPEHFYLWEDLDNPGNSRYATQLDQTFYVWIIQVDASVVWIDGETFVTSNAAAVQGVQDVVNSIRFE